MYTACITIPPHMRTVEARWGSHKNRSGGSIQDLFRVPSDEMHSNWKGDEHVSCSVQ